MQIGRRHLAQQSSAVPRRVVAESDRKPSAPRSSLWRQPSRSRPASVNRNSLLRRSVRPGAMLINPSRSSGRMFRPSVVRSITSSSASSLIVATRAAEPRQNRELVVRRPPGRQMLIIELGNMPRRLVDGEARAFPERL